MGLSIIATIALILILAVGDYFINRLDTREKSAPTNTQKKACLCISVILVIWFAVYLSGLWYRLDLPELGFYIVSFIVIASSIGYPVYLFIKKIAFRFSPIIFIIGVLLLMLLILGAMVAAM